MRLSEHMKKTYEQHHTLVTCPYHSHHMYHRHHAIIVSLKCEVFSAFRLGKRLVLKAYYALLIILLLAYGC